MLFEPGSETFYSIMQKKKKKQTQFQPFATDLFYFEKVKLIA